MTETLGLARGGSQSEEATIKKKWKEVLSQILYVHKNLFLKAILIWATSFPLFFSLPPFLLGFKTSSVHKGNKSIKWEKDVKEWSRKQLQF